MSVLEKARAHYKRREAEGEFVPQGNLGKIFGYFVAEPLSNTIIGAAVNVENAWNASTRAGGKALSATSKVFSSILGAIPGFHKN